MPPKVALPSLRTESGLAQFNELLKDRSYIEGGFQATLTDLAKFSEIQHLPDQQQFPHIVRWYHHVQGLKEKYADGIGPKRDSASSSGGRADAPKNKPAAKPEVAKKPAGPAKGENKSLVIDCQPRPVQETRIPADVCPPLGAGSKPFPNAAESKHGRYYITTAITYANGWPHIGHAYEALTSDVFARYHRLLGKDVFFVTGSDEHGQKIAQTAEDAGLTPQAMVDKYVASFKALNQRLTVSEDFFVRTTAKQHKDVAKAVWKMCKDAGDIYLDRYEGWYLVREERFVAETEAKEWNFKDPNSGVPLKKMSEPSFFFKLSKFQEKLLKHMEEHEEFIQPQQYRTEIMERLKSIELRDLSISRGTFEWGVPCPEDKVDDKEHVMYVWFDALINYISAIDGIDSKKPLSRFWPADMHVIGKDISWFHSVIWPAMLMSANIKLPKSIVVHGFISGADGRKMSKSFGNVVNPHELLDWMPSDSLRWYLCRESAFGDDVKFSVPNLKMMHNSELCDNLGNLVNRAVSLCKGKIPKGQPGQSTQPFDLAEIKAAMQKAMVAYKLAEGAEIVIRACAATNKWIADLEPWKMKDAEKDALRQSILRMLIEAVYVLAHFFAPYIPLAAEAIFDKIAAKRPIPELKDDFMNLSEGSPVNPGSVLYAVFP